MFHKITLKVAVDAFPLWIAVGATVAILYPPALFWFRGEMITWGLGVIMLAMGLSLRWTDFVRISSMPRKVLIGVGLQFSVMPGLGWLLGQLLDLPNAFVVGLILVSCCPGGTASNLIVYLAKADVALSVTLTAVSTLVAIFATPFLCTFLVGDRVEIDALALLVTTARVVVIPIALGLALRSWLPRLTALINPWAPFSAVIAIVLIVGSILASSRGAIIEQGHMLIVAILLLHLGGFAIGYVATRCFSDSRSAQTISVEVGMQNSGLGAVLAHQHFASPLVAVPAALSALTHCVIGAVLATWWRRGGLYPESNENDR